MTGHLQKKHSVFSPRLRSKMSSGIFKFVVGVVFLASAPSTSSIPASSVADMAWVAPSSMSSCLQRSRAQATSSRPQRTLIEMRSGPRKGEVRNPWGRAGKPETREARLREAEETAAFRANEWRKALSIHGDWDDIEELTAMEARGVTPTEDIRDFHERAAHVIRESGGRIHSLTFSYKWEQQYGENLHSFVRRQRLSVPAMLRQSGRFVVVDMQGMMSGEDEDMDVSKQMQVYVLNEQTVQQTGRGQPLGDQLGMHGESDAIKQWRRRRTSTLSRQDKPSPLAPEIVGMPAEGAHECDVSSARNYQTFSTEDHDEPHGNMEASEIPCMKLPDGFESMNRIGAVIRAIEPSLAGATRQNLRQMHVAWSSARCQCAGNAVTMLKKLGELEDQAKGKMIRKVDEQIRVLADIIQSGISSLDVEQIATALDVVVRRGGYDSLVLFAANRVLQGGKKFLGDASECNPEAVATLIRVMVKSGQRDPLLYRQLSTACHWIPAGKFTVSSMAEILEWLHRVGSKDPLLLRHFSSVLQQLPSKKLSPEGIARMAEALAVVGMHDEAVFRRLSVAVLQLKPQDFTAATTSRILYSFVRAGLKDPAMLQRLSDIAQTFEPVKLAAADVTKILAAMTMAKRRDIKLLQRMGNVILQLGDDGFTPRQLGAVARAYAEAEIRNEQVFAHLAAAALKLEPWTFDVAAVSMIVDAYARIGVRDQALFGRLSTVLQQLDSSAFTLQNIGTIVKAYAHPVVEDKELLEKLATVLHQMDGSVFGTADAVQEVSVILNAYASANMRELALDLSQTLTNHLRPYVGGLTAQAMANIVLRVHNGHDGQIIADMSPSLRGFGYTNGQFREEDKTSTRVG